MTIDDGEYGYSVCVFEGVFSRSAQVEHGYICPYMETYVLYLPHQNRLAPRTYGGLQGGQATTIVIMRRNPSWVERRPIYTSPY